MTEEIKPNARKRDNQGGLLRMKIRALMREHPEGMTLKHINELVDGKAHSIYRAIKRMPDAYCSHWIDPVGEKQQAVYKVVVVPADCPQPKPSRMTDNERRTYLREYRIRKKQETARGKVTPVEPKAKPARMSHEEMAARDAAMVNRYSNPPTYKALK